jgi:ABC-type uncharacterized transport system auxiliary subunit
VRKRNLNAVSLPTLLTEIPDNYSPLANQTNSDKVLLIQLNAFGAQRNYAGFIPMGAPQAFCYVTGTLINTKDNKVIWRYKADVLQPIIGNWDQPPTYPNLDTAIKQAVTIAQQEILDNFFTQN